MKNNKKEINLSFSPGSLIYSLLTASAIALLAILAAWGFELRSTVKWLLQGTALILPLTVLLYLAIFRNFSAKIKLEFWSIIITFASSVILTWQLVPPQLTAARTLIVYAVTTSLFLILATILLQIFARYSRVNKKLLIGWALLIAGLAGIALVLRNTFYARIYADDFCYAVDYARLGFPGAGLFFYRDWSGRFFSNFLVMGLADQPRTITFLLSLTTLSIMALLLSLDKNQQGRQWLLALAGGPYFTLTIAMAAPDFYKSHFWTGSALVLFPVFILFPIYLILSIMLLRVDKQKAQYWPVLAFFLSFAITTTHEVASLGWLFMNGIILVWSLFSKKNDQSFRYFITAGIIAALLGLIVILLSPGIDNRAQVQQYSGADSMVDTFLITIDNFFEFFMNVSSPYYFFERDGRASWLLMTGLFGLGWALDAPFQRSWHAALLVFVTALLMTLASFIPGAYVYRGNIPLRSQMIPVFYLSMGVLLGSMALPRPKIIMVQNSFYLLVIISVLLGMRLVIPQMWRINEPLQAYARAWDLRNEEYLMSSDIPPRITIPWDAYEQNIDCIELYYSHIDF